MIMRKTLNIIFIIVLLTKPAVAQVELSEIDKPLTLFYNLKYNEALPLFHQLVEKEPHKADVQTWLAETYRRIGNTEKAIQYAGKALTINPCSSFAHLVIAQASYPNHDSILVHVKKAIECDSSDPNAWLMMWGEAIKLGDTELHHKSLIKLAETGFLTKAALAYGRAELRYLPQNAIYITGGDMDTYPAKIVQVSEGFRADVTVIEQEHLGINWAARFIRDHQGVQLSVSDTDLDLMKNITDSQGKTITTSQQMLKRLIDQKLSGEFKRPIAIAPTVSEKFYDSYKEYFQYSGMYLLFQPVKTVGIIDTAAVRECISGLNPEDFTGSWVSANDRSPVRRFYNKRIVINLYNMVLCYVKEIIKSKRFKEAENMLCWLEAFEKKTELGPVSTNEIVQLRNLMKHN